MHRAVASKRLNIQAAGTTQRAITHSERREESAKAMPVFQPRAGVINCANSVRERVKRMLGVRNNPQQRRGKSVGVRL
jgi:hypothetical protein